MDAARQVEVWAHQAGEPDEEGSISHFLSFVAQLAEAAHLSQRQRMVVMQDSAELRDCREVFVDYQSAYPGDKERTRSVLVELCTRWAEHLLSQL